MPDPKLFRPPYGLYDKRVKGVIERCGYKMVNWDVDARDWEKPKAKIIADKIISAIRHNSIILLHDGSNIRQGKSRAQTAAALEIIIKNLRKKGFVFDTNIYL